MDLNLDNLFLQGNSQYENLLTTTEQPTITLQSYQQENMQCGDLLSTAVQPTITSEPYQITTSTLDGSLLQNICEEVRRSNSNQDCILQELKLMNRNIETLCQQRQYIFPSPTPVKVPVENYKIPQKSKQNYKSRRRRKEKKKKKQTYKDKKQPFSGLPFTMKGQPFKLSTQIYQCLKNPYSQKTLSLFCVLSTCFVYVSITDFVFDSSFECNGQSCVMYIPSYS